MRKALKRLGWTIGILFIVLNIIAFFHAYKFTHFAEGSTVKTKNPGSLSTPEKFKALFLGVDNPKPLNTRLPGQVFTTIRLQSVKNIACWSIPADSSKGTVILFHGYGGNKSSMLDKSDEFLAMGYSILLVDFMGCGDSEGNQTTIGFKEAADVKTAFEYVQAQQEKNIFLFGTSLGAVAIMKAVGDYSLQPKAILVECPFGSMYQTVCARFTTMGVPTFPMAGLLVFWGGIQNGFWAFDHNPAEYAKKIYCPTLLLYGEKDEKVSRVETDEIYRNLAGKKELRTYPEAGHENYLRHYREQWVRDAGSFLAALR